MSDLLPSSPDPAAGDGGDPRVIGVDSDDADDLLAALQSETARDLLAALYDDPATPSTLAEEVDTSIQNVRYHLENLTDADLVEVADTVYSEKGREMKVYAPAAKPLVVFAGGEDDAPGIEAALSRLLGGLGVLGLSSLLVQRFASGGPVVPGLSFGVGGAGDSVDTTTEGEDATYQGQEYEVSAKDTDVQLDAATETTRTVTEASRTFEAATETAPETVRQTTEEAARTTTVADATTVTEAAGGMTGGLPPGLLFFAGGLVVLLAFAVAWYLRAR